MQYNEFIEQVQQRANLGNPADAERIVEATLGTLGELIYRTERHDLAAQLPQRFQDIFYAYQPPENTRADTQTYSLEEFYHRVQSRAGRNSYPTTIKEAKAVVSVLEEAVSAGEIDDVRAVLPAEYGGLFEQA